MNSGYGIISGGQPPQIYRTVTKCKAGLSIAWLLVFIVCFLCFCCSVSSSFGAMYWQRQSICKNVRQTTVTNALDEITETFRNTTPCNWDNKKDVIYDPNAFRNANQIY